MQVTDVYSAVDDNKYRMHKAYKNYGFAKAVLISHCNATKQLAATIDTTTSKEATSSEKINHGNQRKCGLHNNIEL